MAIDPRTIRTKPRGIALRLIVDDRPCRKCKYNLKGISRDAVCPECGTPITEVAVEEKVDYIYLLPLSPTAPLMSLSRADMRRMGTATTLMAAGTVGLSLGMGLLWLMSVVARYGGSLGPDVASAWLVITAFIGGLLWAGGVVVLLLPRRGPIEPRAKHRPLGSVGATTAATDMVATEGQKLKAVGESWPAMARGLTAMAQFLVPLAVLLSVGAVQASGFNPSAPAGIAEKTAQVVWILALLALLPAAALLVDLARSASDDPSLGRLISSLLGVVVGGIAYICSDLVVPHLIFPVIGDLSGLVGFIVLTFAMVTWPATILYTWGLLSLSSTCRWAPANAEELDQRDRRQVAEDIAKAKEMRERDRQAWAE